jgi:signal transduction histidine kinase
VHGLETDLTTIGNYLSLARELLESRPDNFEGKIGKILENSEAALDHSLFNLQAFHSQPPDSPEKTQIDMRFMTNLARRSQNFARVEGSPPISFTLPQPGHLDRLPPVAVARRVLEATLLQIISNAIRYRKIDTPPSVSIAVGVRGSNVRFDVCDSGIGIPALEESRIFMQGYRGPAARLLSVRGSGLGLYIAAAHIRSSGGSLFFERNDSSTCFAIVLKIAGGGR